MNKEIKKVIGKFLTNWKKKNWVKMAKYTQLTWRSNHWNNVKWLEGWFWKKDLRKWTITDIKIVGDACRDVYIEIDYGKGIKEIKARVICETAPYKPSIEGNWGINPISCLKEKIIE